MAMYQGNWTCSKCGGEIKELPFKPRSNAGLTCRDCFFKAKDGQSGGQGNGSNALGDMQGTADIDDRDAPPFDPEASGIAGEPAPDSPEMEAAPAAGERKMFSGEWQCATCGGSITQLPFEPRNTENLKCIDCFKKSKG